MSGRMPSAEDRGDVVQAAGDEAEPRPGAALLALEETGLYAALRARGVHAVVAHQSISARMPTPAERRHLRIRGTQPVLAMTRMAFDGAGTAVEYGDHSYRAEDYTIDLMVDER